ncbi:phosphoglycerate dehydrogenase-like enzyme [Anaerotaenia torta]|uniref:D-2-hydroxyacid dehydrogenase n=1 Tax=Anaerotaenia torta TaxID=433293 RepID=UPI003D24D6F6
MNEKLELLVITTSIFPMNEEQREDIINTAPGISVTVAEARKVTREMIENAEIIFGWLTKEQKSWAKKLRWLHLPSAGADGYTQPEEYCNKDIRISTSSGVFGQPIAEHVFAMILSHNRNLQEYAYYKAEKRWVRGWETKDFFGSTIGILGLGDIGSQIAKRAKAWGARVLAIKRSRTPAPDYVDGLYTMEEIDEVLAQSDYVVLALPNTHRTKGLISEEKLRLMKPGAFLVNIGRGSLIDQEALIKALTEGRIGGAGLDVTDPEPLPEDSPLWELPNVILTPHTSGGSPTNDRRRLSIFLHNLECYIKDRPLQNQVDFTQEY